MTMKYLMLIYMANDAMTEAEHESCCNETVQYARELKANGNYLCAHPLHPTTTATKIQQRNGKTLVTDGPFAETREHLGGFFLIDAPNLDKAIHIASRMPATRKGTVEIRPIADLEGLPND
jgi:hypothetical protein